MWFNHQTFYTAYEQAFAPLSAPKLSGLDRLLGFVQLDPDVVDVRWVAYMLATVKHECADSWQPITEFGKDSYFLQYERPPKAGPLGNTQAGDGLRFKGRGYVQITGRGNYGKLSKRLGLGTSLVDDPERVLDPLTAYRIMSIGMREGVFTGKTLSAYLTGDKTDYVNARRIINRLDQADKIAGHAERLQDCLEGALQS
ncbi:hypothetical protein AB4156_01470 [Cupriavidus sp. 2MCAB6]|uniref:hypothetical protein n=1 Tax=Cupriavidus sp. 2MCAB6 TaxID=3232981 RepID=UPI003F8E322F